MRTNEERAGALHRRAAHLEREQRNNRFRMVCAVSGAVCIGILIGVAVLIPGVTAAGFSAGSPAAMNGSIFSDSSVPGYIAIAILAFLLGITVTVFCFRLKKYMDEKDREDFR